MAHKWLICFLIILSTSHAQKSTMSCSYGGRGSLTSICVNANAAYFRKSSYRFDNLDETVRCVNCSLQVLESGSFDLPGNQIKHLNLENSQITVLKSKAFIGLVFLESLNLDSNLINIIPPETFQGVTKIQSITANRNVIGSLVANAFTGLTNLYSLSLSNNQITSIETDAFAGLTALRTLDLSNNRIRNLHNIFTAPAPIDSLNLEFNKISELYESDFKYLDSVMRLNLHRNSLKIVNKNTFRPVTYLRSLNLSANPMESVEVGAFQGLPILYELDLSNCLIGHVEKGLFSSLHRLRTLDLSYNLLGVFQTGMFSGLPELRALNASHNKIKLYERTGILKLPNLHKLDLSFNELGTIDYRSLLAHLPALAYLGLRNNSLSCYLKSEMEEMFKDDNFHFDLEHVEEACNDPKGEDVDHRIEQVISVAAENRQVYIRSSGDHEYFLYVFIVFSIIVLSILFYLHRRDKLELQKILETDSYEARLIGN